MKHRHMKAKHHAKGGRTDFYEGGESPTAKEAMEKHQMKRGGRAKHHPGKVTGKKAHHRLDKRARGGRTGNSTSSPMAPGSARHPFSSAARG